jgi:hypothetical protein
MNIHDPKHIEVRDKILKGIELGVQNLIKERKKIDGELVVFKDGKIVHLKAKDL